jgi:type IV pilus assembly protein PilE
MTTSIAVNGNSEMRSVNGANAMISRYRNCNATAGFTLVELMIVVAIIAILASMGYPSYVDYVRRGHRAAVQSFMMDVASRQQQRMLDVRSYATSLAALGMSAPGDLGSRYTVTVTTVAGPPATFLVAATPAGSQDGDSCGALRLSSAGNKTPANCW